MMNIFKSKTEPFPNCIPMENTAEDTMLPSSSIDFIFCGNSYHWFDRDKVILEFKRIIKQNDDKNVVIATLSSCGGDGAGELFEIIERFMQPVKDRLQNHSSPFREDSFFIKEFNYVVYQDLNETLNGMLSGSFSPSPQDNCFDEYCRFIKAHFNKYSQNGKLKTDFRLSCSIGNVNDLV